MRISYTFLFIAVAHFYSPKLEKTFEKEKCTERGVGNKVSSYIGTDLIYYSISFAFQIW